MQSVICSLQSVVCSLQSAVCKCQTPPFQLHPDPFGHFIVKPIMTDCNARLRTAVEVTKYVHV